MISNPKNTIVLCATAASLTAGIWHNRKLASFQVFQNNERGQGEFNLFLQANATSKVHLIVDAVEEDYRLESIPHTSGRERKEVLERKLNHAYRGLSFRVAHFIKRGTDKRKDDYYLFAALNNTEFLQGWINCIEMQQSQLVGVYLLPMISQMIVRKLQLMAPHILLCELLDSGLRQTYLHNGRLRMSRLASMQNQSRNRLGYYYLVETEKTRLYLISQRYISKETPLNLVLPTLDMANQEICYGLSQEQGIDCNNVDLASLAEDEGLNHNLLHDNPELLHMQLLVNGHVPDNLAPTNLTKSHQLNDIKRWINYSIWAVWGFGLLLMGYFLLQIYEGRTEFATLAQETVLKQQQYNEVAKNFPVSPVASEDLKVAVELEKKITALPKPRRMMQVVSQALQAYPDVQINRMHWMLTSDLQAIDNEQESDAVTNSGAQSSGVMQEVAFINGEIKHFSGDYRQGLALVRSLSDKIAAMPTVEQVVVVQEPVNVSSMTSLQGATTDAQASIKPSALFKLKVILKPAEVSP